MSERTPDKVGAFDASSLLRPTRYEPAMKRPGSTVAGSALVLLRGLAGVFVLVLLAGQFSSVGKELAENVDGLSSAEASSGLLFFAIVTGVLVLVDLALAIFIYRGHNWPRVIVMSIAVISITASFIAWWWQGQEITLDGSLLSLGLDILVLLALSSRSAAAYARRNQRN